MTAQAAKDDMVRCLEASMNDYITKPIKKEIIFDEFAKSRFCSLREHFGRSRVIQLKCKNSG
jgi:PleD family two-component response regulator